MKKEDFKRIIKPIIKECIREVLLEEGLKTLTGNQELVKEEKIIEKVEKNSKEKQKIDYNKVFNKDVIEKNKKLGFDLGGNGFNPFKNTIPSNEKEKMIVETQTSQKINNLIGESAGQWNKILDAMNGRK